jgi:uncharacterized protein (TIGR02217 family)
MTGFHEVRFPDNIAYGATGGPEFATTVVVTGAGHEQRNVDWAEARGRWDVASGLKNQQQRHRWRLRGHCQDRDRRRRRGRQQSP